MPRWCTLAAWLLALLHKAEELGLDPRRLSLRAALVSAEPLPPSLRAALVGSREVLPAVGLGTWLTFHVDVNDAAAMARRRALVSVATQPGKTQLTAAVEAKP